MTDTTASTPPSRRPRLSPVTRQELADRFRGTRGGKVVTGYVALLGLALYLLYLVMASIARFDGGASYAAIGRSMFDTFMAIQLAVALFFGAGYAASQIASEREKRTLPLLQITRLTPFGIAAGKWWAVTAWQVLLLVVGMPLAAAAAFFGGVMLADVLVGTAYMIVVVATFSAVAIAVSATMRRTTTAIVTTYGLLAGLMIGPGVLAIVEFLVTDRTPRLSMALHPFTGLAVAVDTPAVTSLPTLLTPFRMVYASDGLGNGQVATSLWWLLAVQVCTCLVVTVLCLRWAATRVQPGRGPRRRSGGGQGDDAAPAPVGALPAPPPAVPPPAPPDSRGP